MSFIKVPTTKRKAPLHPVKVDSQKRIIGPGNPAKPRWWRVNVGKKFTGTSKKRRFFATEKEAKGFIAETIEARKKKGQSAFDVPAKLAHEAMALAAQLEPHEASLTEAVNFFLRHHGKGLRLTINDLIPEYLRTKANAKYRRAQAISLRLFARHFGSKPINSIFAPAIEQWFGTKGWKPLNQRNYIRDFSMFFNWAKLHDYVSDNPLRKVIRPRIHRHAPEIFTVEEVRKLLETATAHPELDLLPMYAIALFSGVRIEELRRMKWEMIHWSEGEIRLPAEITKTRNPRNIEIFDSLRAWIGRNPVSEGMVVASVNLRLRREKLFLLAGVIRKRNALRHSFASYYAAARRDPGALQLLLGQETPSVLFKHYITATTRKDAEAFFNVVPVNLSHRNKLK